MEPETTLRPPEAVPVTDRVVSAVAEATGTDPLELEPLNEVVDPDALDALFSSSGLRSARPPRRVEFAYAGRTVVVTGGGTVEVTD